MILADEERRRDIDIPVMHEVKLDDALKFLKLGNTALVLNVVDLGFAQGNTCGRVLHKNLHVSTYSKISLRTRYGDVRIRSPSKICPRFSEIFAPSLGWSDFESTSSPGSQKSKLACKHRNYVHGRTSNNRRERWTRLSQDD